MSKFIKVRDVNDKGEWRIVICEQNPEFKHIYTPIPQYQGVALSTEYERDFDKKGNPRKHCVVSELHGLLHAFWEGDKLPV